MLSTATLYVVSVSLLLGGTAGFVMHRSDFCIAGVFRDLFLFRQTFMLRILLILIFSSMIFFELARHFGILRDYPYLWIGSASLSNILGAFLFGIGMVLAGGCVVGTLYKMGSGNLLSLYAFCGLLFGSVIYAEIHPLWTSLFAKTVVFSGLATLPQLLDIDPTVLVLLAALLILGLWAVVLRKLPWSRDAAAEGYLQPWKAALILALIGLFSYVLVGMPLGITTAYTKLGALVEQLFFPQHVSGLSYLSAQPIHYIPPFSDVSFAGGAGPQFDAVAIIQYPLIVGIILGSAVSAIRLGEFRVRLQAPKRQIVSVLVGGVVMGLACRMTPGCNVWHLLGGLPIFSLQAVFYLVGLIPGAWVGSRVLQRFVVR